MSVRPRALVGRVIPQETILRVQELFTLFGKIPELNFLTLWKLRYGETFSAAELGFDDGLIGFFRELGNIIDMNVGTWGRNELSLKPQFLERISQLNRKPKKNYNLPDVFSHEHECLWSRQHLAIKASYQILIPLSPYESALMRERNLVSRAIAQIRQVLKRFPEGIPLNQIISFVNINKRLFSVTSIATLVHEYPEIFFLPDDQNENSEPIVYDGSTRTYESLQEEDGIATKKIIFFSINSGMYQKTLILIKESGIGGLKIAVWFDALKRNFKHLARHKYENALFNISPIRLAKSLCTFGLVRIESSQGCRNDLRLRLPNRKIDFDQFMSAISQHLLHDKKLEAQQSRAIY